jgi:hypothetical protein
LAETAEPPRNLFQKADRRPGSKRGGKVPAFCGSSECDLQHPGVSPLSRTDYEGFRLPRPPGPWAVAAEAARNLCGKRGAVRLSDFAASL